MIPKTIKPGKGKTPDFLSLRMLFPFLCIPMLFIFLAGGHSAENIITSHWQQKGEIIASQKGEKKKDKNKSKSKKDYWEHWKKIYFSSVQFQQTVDRVDSNYIDKKYSRNTCYIEAARYALYTLEKSLDLYPEEYFKRRREFEKKDEIVKGKTVKLHADDKFLIFIADKKKKGKTKKKKADKKKNGRKDDTDESIKKLIKRIKVRRKFISSEWEKIEFGESGFRRVLNHIVRNYRSDKKFKLKHIYVNATLGYLHGLDPHCSLIVRKHWEKVMREIQDSSFEGIGALLQGGGVKPVLVVNPIEDYPAVKAGLRSGDIILEVDGKNISGMMLDAVVKRIRGKKGKTVVLKVKRPGVVKPIIVPIVRAYIKIENISGKMIGKEQGVDIGYMKMRGFVSRSTIDIYHLYKQLRNKGDLKGLIIDLRNNGGGLLNQAVSITNLFLGKGDIVTVKSSWHSANTFKADMRMIADNMVIVVLINSLSASASEIVASALQDHARALIIGRRSFGKATVQKLIPNSQNCSYYVKLTTERYYAPSGRTIQVVGVRPDVRIPETPKAGFPYRYREEDSWNHLPAIQYKYKSANKDDVPFLKSWVEKNGMADRIYKTKKNSAIKPDYRMLVAVDYIKAMLALKKAKSNK